MSQYRLISLLLVVVLLLVAQPAAAQTPTPDQPPFSLPFTDPPGPNTWLYEQHYGNTTAAYNYGDVWYASGQGLHFGVDFEAPCGTPVHAIADGVVMSVDAPGFGAGPHSIVLNHTGTGYSSLYGHLYQQSPLLSGNTVKRGDEIGLSGDPDETCGSRPHLHLEIRSTDYQTTYNPLPFFAVNWHMLASVGPYNHNFQQDLDTPYRWMRLEDQPEVHFGGPRLNNYLRPWPPKLELRAPINPPALRHLDPLPENVNVALNTVAVDQWNIGSWWRANDPNAVYLFDAIPGQDTGIFRQPLDGSPREFVEMVPPTLVSPGGDVAVRHIGSGTMAITRLSDQMRWDLYLNGVYPSVSPDGTRLLWEVLSGEIVPGSTEPGLAVWVSNLDGSLPRRVHTQAGGWSMWLDARRLLLVKRIPFMAETQLYVLDIDDPAVTPVLLGAFDNLHGLQVAPGGGNLVFFLTFQENSGVYVLATQPGSLPRKLEFFGAYRWRDDQSLYTLSYDLNQDVHSLGYIDITQGVHRTLTSPDQIPLRIANGEWSVSPDGTRIMFINPLDYGMYALTVG